MTKEPVELAEQHKRTITYFLAKDAVADHNLGGFLGVGTASEETGKKFAALKEAGHDDGLTLHLLYRQPGGFSLIMVWVKPNFPLPRHSHDTDCMYYVATGSIVMGDKVLRAGDGFFVPRDCLYIYSAGPEGAEVLEIRCGPDVVNSYVPTIPGKRFETDLEVVKANAEHWKEMKAGPTLVANVAAG